MLRAKQLGTLTQCARSFYLSGSRSGSVDGASCGCSEDETCVSKSQSAAEQKRIVATEAPAKSGSPDVQNASGSVNHIYTGYSASSPQSLSSKSTSNSEITSGNRRIISVHGVDHASRFLHSSKETNGAKPKSGIASAGVFSELISRRAPATVAHGSETPHESGVDSASVVSSSKSYRGKPRNKAICSKGHPGPSTVTDKRSNPNLTPQNESANAIPEAGHVKAKQNFSAAPVVTCKSQSETESQQQPAQHREKFHSGTCISDYKSDGRELPAADKIGLCNKSGYSSRPVRAHGGAAPSNFRTINSTRVVEQYYHTLQQLKWGPTAEQALDIIRYKLDAFQANQVLKLLHDHSVALGFFRWLKSQPGFRHDCHTYTTMIGILGHARQFGTMRTLLQDMICDGCRPTVVTYNRLIHAYGRANYIRDAVKVFEEMQEAGYEPDRVTYCTLIDIHAKAGYLEVALNLYHRMHEVGLSPDTFTYSVMVNCLGKGGRLAAAYKLFCEMIDHGCVPNLVTYNIMIALQAKARNYPCVVKLYKDMQVAGFRADKITYSIVMEVLGHCGHLDEAEAVFFEMTRDWVPDELVYGLLVDMWGKAGNVSKARAWYQAMLDTGLQPNVPICNSLLSAFLKVHQFDEAYRVLHYMLGLGLVPSLQTYTLLLSCCTDSHSEMGLRCQLMAITGHPAHDFLLYLPDAEPGGQNVRDHVGHFFDMMHSEDRESKRGLVDAVIDFLHKAGLKEEAGFMWEVAAQRNVYPDSVREKSNSYWLINLHLMSEGTAVTALSRTLAWFQRQLLDFGTGPWRIDIVTGWGRRSRVTGSSLVRQSVQKLLNLFGFPFSPSGNYGCFVGSGEPLNRWLLNSYVERMHLL